MKILSEVIKKADLADAENILDETMVKGAVDIERGLLAIDAEMHADLEKLLLEDGSRQDGVWGINLWFDADGEDFVEFDSMINIRPRQGNRTRGVENSDTQAKIIKVVQKWIQ